MSRSENASRGRTLLGEDLFIKEKLVVTLVQTVGKASFRSLRSSQDRVETALSSECSRGSCGGAAPEGWAQCMESCQEETSRTWMSLPNRPDGILAEGGLVVRSGGRGEAFEQIGRVRQY